MGNTALSVVSNRSKLIRLVTSIAIFALGTTMLTGTSEAQVHRAFTADSYWNTPLPSDAPVHQRSNTIIDFLKNDNVHGCPLLSGTGSNEWGMPVYWAQPSDPTYNVTTRRYAVPDEFSNLRIPHGARPMNTSDGELVVYDLDRGLVAELSAASYDSANDSWTVEGGSIAYLDGNGIDHRLSGGDPRNDGTFRGYNGDVAMVRYDEVAAGAVNKTLKIGVNTGNVGHQYPFWGSDGQSTSNNAPIQGARLRISPDVDLDSYNLHPQARPIAEALQTYGAVVGDTTGAPIELKLEDTQIQGRGQLWSLPDNALCSIPLDVYEVIDYGYVPPPQTPDDSSDPEPEPEPEPDPVTDGDDELLERLGALEDRVDQLELERDALRQHVDELELWRSHLGQWLDGAP